MSDPLDPAGLMRQCAELESKIKKHKRKAEKLTAARDRIILLLHGSGLTTRQIGAGLNLSGPRICQILAKARKLVR